VGAARRLAEAELLIPAPSGAAAAQKGN